MKAANSICRRCHRLRPVNGARYCATCSEELRAAERRRPAVDAGNAALTPSLATPGEAPPKPDCAPTCGVAGHDRLCPNRSAAAAGG